MTAYRFRGGERHEFFDAFVIEPGYALNPLPCMGLRGTEVRRSEKETTVGVD